MARIVLGIGTSHGPMLSSRPEDWHVRAGMDRGNRNHWFRGERHDFAGVKGLALPGLPETSLPAECARRHADCQRALDRLAGLFAEARPDLVVVIGNDQQESLRFDLMPALLVYAGETIPNVAFSEQEIAAMPPGLAFSIDGHCPPETAEYRGAPAAATAILRALLDQDFDVAYSERLPQGPDRSPRIAHAFGFAYRRIMRDAPPPSVPVYLNVGEGPNRLSARRCLAFGHALARAVAALPGDDRVALVASGGLTHFVVDEELDRRMLAAFERGDEASLAAIPEPWFNGNTCESKSWIALSAAMNEARLRCEPIDYVACYRTEAGTGNGMGFAAWRAG